MCFTKREWSRSQSPAGHGGHIFTFFFFFFLSESGLRAAVEGCCCCCCCRGSTASSSGKRAYCKPGAEKQSFVKWPAKNSNDLFKGLQNKIPEKSCCKQLQSCLVLSVVLFMLLFVPLQPHFAHVVLSTASSVILLPVWSLNILRRLASCLQSHTVTITHTHTHLYMHRQTHTKITGVNTYSALTLLGSRSRPVPWLTAFIEKDIFTFSSRIWEVEERAAAAYSSVCVCVCSVCVLCVVCCYLFPNDFNPHLFTHIDDFGGVLNPWGRHLTHMNQAFVCRRKEVRC